MGYKAGQKQLIRSVQHGSGPFFYTAAATFMKDGRLFRQGLFLEDHTGKILGRRIEDINGEEQCDGCAVLTYRDGLKLIYPIENLFLFPELPYPVLLEDSSTVEGRAIDLFSFSATGEPSLYRKYEYMVTCILGPDSNITTSKPNHIR